MKQFRQFRIIFRLVKQTGIDMMPFTGFLLLSMILFGTTFYHLNTTTVTQNVMDADGNEVTDSSGEPIFDQYNNHERRPITESLLYEYLLVFGEFDMEGFDDDKYGERWILWIMATTLLQLIMLNLLIAIMSDTFAKVMSEIEISDGMELNNLIIEAEKLTFKNRNKVAKHVLHWVEYKTEDAGDWGGGNNEVTKALSATEEVLLKALKQQGQTLRSLQTRMATQTTFNNIKNDELSKKMDTLMAENQKKMDAMMTLIAGDNLDLLQKNAASGLQKSSQNDQIAQDSNAAEKVE